MAIDPRLAEALLRYLAKKNTGLDPDALIAWAHGDTSRIAGIIAQAIVSELGLPPGWQPDQHLGGKSAVANPSHARQSETSGMNRTEWGYELGQRRIARRNAIYDWMASEHLSTETLAQRISTALKRQVTRATLQTYIAGSQKTKRGERKVLAPVDVREAVTKLSQGQVKVTDWPNADKD